VGRIRAVDSVVPEREAVGWLSNEHKRGHGHRYGMGMGRYRGGIGMASGWHQDEASLIQFGQAKVKGAVPVIQLGSGQSSNIKV